MAHSPKVSVILTSFNHAKYLREAIDSVLNQTFDDFELIIWDDASLDGSWEIIQSYSDSRIKVFRNEEQMRAVYGLNKAISDVATGEYIAIHHSDDVWEPEKLGMQVAFLSENTGYGAVFTSALAIDEDGAELNDSEHYYSTIFDQQNRPRHEWLNYFFYKGNALCHPSVLIRKRCYEDCGLYRPGLAQVGDFHMWVRLCLKYEIYVMPEKFVRFRVRDNEANASGNRPDARIRTVTELYVVLKCFLYIDDAKELETIFPEAHEYNRDGDCVVHFALAMIALHEATFHWNKFFGIELLFDLLADAEKSTKIKSLYNFDYRDLVALTGKLDSFQMIYAMRCQDEISLLKQIVDKLEAQFQLTGGVRDVEMSNERHNYEYEVDMSSETAPANVIEMVGQRKRVLEIGCGPGSITKILARQGLCRVTGLELDPDAIKRVKPFCEAVMEADLNSSDWPRLLDHVDRFDVVVAADVLEHLYDPWATLKRMVPLIGPQGYLVISLPHVGHAAVASCLVNGDFQYRNWGLLDRTHIRFFGLKNMEDLFVQAGLKIIEARYVVRSPENTEFAHEWSKLSRKLKVALSSSPHAHVYQVVFKAVPLNYHGDAVKLVPPRPRSVMVSSAIASLKLHVGARISPRIKQKIRKGFVFLGIKL